MLENNYTYHTPVLLDKVIEGLNINPNGIYLDLTFGGGGHSKAILDKLSGGRLIAFDQDDDARRNIFRENENFIFVKSNFRYFQFFLDYFAIEKVDGIFADLGISSHHIDDNKRGFSFRDDSTILDMRMNVNAQISARDIINSYTQQQLADIFRLYGELKNAKQIASFIVRYRENKEIITVGDLKEAIKKVLHRNKENKFLAKLFQAIRIEVNDEMAALKDLLEASPKYLKEETGRLVIITYHSIEDRLVKNFFKSGNFDGKQNKDIYGNVIRPLTPVNNKVITPDEKEIAENTRSRSAKLRIAVKNG